MEDDSGSILHHISTLKDMLDKVNEDIEQNIQKTREIESEIVKHSETEKEYLRKESQQAKALSVAEFELNGLVQVSAAAMTSLKVMEDDLRLQKVTMDAFRKRFSNKMERFILECSHFQTSVSKGSDENLTLLLQEKESLQGESEDLRMKINTIQTSSEDYIADVVQELRATNSVLESELQHGISEYMDVLKDINNLKILYSSINS